MRLQSVSCFDTSGRARKLQKFHPERDLLRAHQLALVAWPGKHHTLTRLSQSENIARDADESRESAADQSTCKK
jgi:hypothetical protein